MLELLKEGARFLAPHDFFWKNDLILHSNVSAVSLVIFSMLKLQVKGINMSIFEIQSGARK